MVKKKQAKPVRRNVDETKEVETISSSSSGMVIDTGAQIMTRNKRKKTGQPSSDRQTKRGATETSLDQEYVQLLNRLIRKGGLKMMAPEMRKKVATKEDLEYFSDGEDEEHRMVQGDWYCCKAMKGRRDYMEDTFAVHLDGAKEKEEKPILFGVFDGHGGTVCSDFCKMALLKMISKHEHVATDTTRSLIESFVSMDDICSHVSRYKSFQDGSTATVAAIHRKERKLYVGHVGDTRCVLISSSGKAEALTRDHHGNLADERKRIEDLGGHVFHSMGVYRVQGVLAVTRAIGDASLKPFATGTPETKEVNLDDDHSYLCIASDGIWDQITNKEVARILNQHGMVEGTERVVSTAYNRGSDDNLTFMAIDLKSIFNETTKKPEAQENEKYKQGATKTNTKTKKK